MFMNLNARRLLLLPWIIDRTVFSGNKDCLYRGYYTVARRNGFYVRVARTISQSISLSCRVMFFLLYGYFECS